MHSNMNREDTSENAKPSKRPKANRNKKQAAPPLPPWEVTEYTSGKAARVAFEIKAANKEERGDEAVPSRTPKSVARPIRPEAVPTPDPYNSSVFTNGRSRVGGILVWLASLPGAAAAKTAHADPKRGEGVRRRLHRRDLEPPQRS